MTILVVILTSYYCNPTKIPAIVTSENLFSQRIETMLILISVIFPTIHVRILYFPLLTLNRTGRARTD
jgi:hypothetical protein